MAIAHVQTPAGGVANASATSVALAFVSNVTAGSMIVVGWRYSVGGRTVTCSDDKGNTYVNAVEAINTNDANSTSGVSYALNCAAGATTVTFGISGGALNLRMACSEFSGAATSAALDQSASAIGTTATNMTTATVTPGVDGELFFYAVHTGADATVTPGTDFAEATVVPTGAANRLQTEYYVQPTAAAHVGAATSGGGQISWGCAVATFKPGGAAVGQTTPGPSLPGVGVVGLFGPLAFQWVQQWGVDAATGSPQTVTAQVATITLDTVAGTVTAGNATVTAQVATLTLTPIAGTTTGGPTSLTAQVATLTLTPVAGTVVAGGITGTAQVATITLTALPGTVTAGNATKTAQVATITFTGIAGTTTGGPTTLTAQVGIVTLTAIPGTASTTGGGQTITAQVATITLTPIAGTVTGGPVSMSAQVATLTLTAIPGTVIPGGLTKTAQIATLALTALPGTVTAGTATIGAQVALLTLLARAGTVTGGPVTIAAQRGLLTLAAIAGIVTNTGQLPPLVPPFAALLDAYQAYTANVGPRSATAMTVTVTSTVSTTPRTSTVNTTPEGIT